MKQVTFGLVGNPNCGKTTVFNALTGSTQRVGNWPGVTVEKKEGRLLSAGIECRLLDLPGVYSLVSHTQEGSLDEAIACEAILSGESQVIINVIDAANLERHLYLTQQLLEMQVPVIVALNMVDVAKQRRIQIDTAALSQALGVPVVPLVANKKSGIDDLKALCVQVASQPLSTHQQRATIFPDDLTNAIQHIAQALLPHVPQNREYYAIRLLENDYYASQHIGQFIAPVLTQEKIKCEQIFGEETNILIADARYQHIHQLSTAVIERIPERQQHFSDRIDKFVLNRFLGVPIFLAVMYLMFLFAINFAGVFQPFVDGVTQTLFVDGVAYFGAQHHWPVWLIAILASGIGKGINTTMTFIPVLAGMFFSLSFLEASGYMARAAFVMDRAMRALGLPGKSFVPMIVGFGCNVLAIMGARTLDDPRDRILSVVMMPFMSCSARLAIFALFSAAFFPRGGQNVVFALYLIGILAAVVTGFILRKSLLQGKPAPLIMELPVYHVPHFKTLAMTTWMRLQRFIRRAGFYIIPICVLLGALNSVTVDFHLSLGDANQNSLLSALGRLMTPIFAPMGIQHANWPATVGLITGTLAKEVVVATLNTLYTQAGHLAGAFPDPTTFSLWGNLKDAVLTIPENLKVLPEAFSNPILASAPDHTVNPGVYGLMFREFGSQTAAFAYLLFVLLYIPCVSTVAVIARELNRGWALFSVVWGTLLAYMIAVLFYQAATFSMHELQSTLWIGLIILYFVLSFLLLKFFAGRRRVITTQSVFARA